jgi:hypothetical protein
LLVLLVFSQVEYSLQCAAVPGKLACDPAKFLKAVPRGGGCCDQCGNTVGPGCLGAVGLAVWLSAVRWLLQ